MGLQLIAKNDDFSAITFGRLGPSTSVTSGLAGLFALHKDAELALTNFAMGGNITPTIVGSPTIGATGLTSNQTNYIDFNFTPAGNRTLAVVFDVGSVAPAYPVSSFVSGGGEYLEITSNSLQFATVSAPWVSVPKVASRAEMCAVMIANNARVSIYRPRDQAVATSATTISQDKPHKYRTGISTNNTATTAMLFAYWNRTLTQAELNTFYAEMKEYLGSAGVAVI